MRFLVYSVLISMSLVFCGCVSDCKDDVRMGFNGYYINQQQNSSFNQESYVWEDFIFSTNRVEKSIR